MHNLTSRDKVPQLDERLKSTMNALLRHDYVSDLGISENEVRAHWARLKPAMKKCLEEGFHRRYLQALNEVVQTFGKRARGFGGRG